MPTMDRWRTLLGLLVLLTQGAHADNLCDPSCRITIDFPAGGSIVAVEAAQFTFGDGGLVDTVGSVTAYLAAETLPLPAGEALDFEAGGQFALGDAGNIDYSHLLIDGAGTLHIELAGADDRVVIAEDTQLELSSPAILEVSGDVFWYGSLQVDTFVVDGDLTVGVAPPVSSPPSLPCFGSGGLVWTNTAGGSGSISSVTLSTRTTHTPISPAPAGLRLSRDAADDIAANGCLGVTSPDFSQLTITGTNGIILSSDFVATTDFADILAFADRTNAGKQQQAATESDNASGFGPAFVAFLLLLAAFTGVRMRISHQRDKQV